MSGTAPDACTLPTVEQPLRIAEFESAFSAHELTVQRPAPTRLVINFLRAEPAFDEVIADLTARETACCSFFSFTQTRMDADLRLEVEVPAARAGVLDGLAALTRQNAS